MFSKAGLSVADSEAMHGMSYHSVLLEGMSSDTMAQWAFARLVNRLHATVRSSSFLKGGADPSSPGDSALSPVISINDAHTLDYMARQDCSVYADEIKALAGVLERPILSLDYSLEFVETGKVKWSVNEWRNTVREVTDMLEKQLAILGGGQDVLIAAPLAFNSSHYSLRPWRNSDNSIIE